MLSAIFNFYKHFWYAGLFYRWNTAQRHLRSVAKVEDFLASDWGYEK
jgi:hypothetical protein